MTKPKKTASHDPGGHGQVIWSTKGRPPLANPKPQTSPAKEN